MSSRPELPDLRTARLHFEAAPVVLVAIHSIGPATAKELADETGVHKSTASRVASTLVEAGLADEDLRLTPGKPGGCPYQYRPADPRDSDTTPVWDR